MKKRNAILLATSRFEDYVAIEVEGFACNNVIKAIAGYVETPEENIKQLVNSQTCGIYNLNITTNKINPLVSEIKNSFMFEVLYVTLY
jgi:hypothetical protein